MARVTYIHWSEADARRAADRLIDAGHEVTVHWSPEEEMRHETLPEVLVISLERLPGQGRAVAQWLWDARYRQAIPLVFVGGHPDAVERTRERFGAAVFCGEHQLASVVSGLRAPSP
jgi:hypothetical protein